MLPSPFSRSCAQIEVLDRFAGYTAQTTCFRTGTVLYVVRTMDDVIWITSAPNLPSPPKNGRNFN